MQKEKQRKEEQRARTTFHHFISDRACILLTCDLTDHAFYQLYCNFMKKKGLVPCSEDLMLPQIQRHIQGIRLIYQGSFGQLIIDRLSI